MVGLIFLKPCPKIFHVSLDFFPKKKTQCPMSRFSVLDVDDLGEVSATISGKLCFPEISTFKFGLGCVQLDSET